MVYGGVWRSMVVYDRRLSIGNDFVWCAFVYVLESLYGQATIEIAVIEKRERAKQI